LHYDLRLERDGVLKSWAVPKGLPPRPGILRLAVNVEDHPLEYVNFEGAIPKGQYGGGMMWKYAQGRYEKTKEKRNGFYFRLQSRQLNGEYRIHHTKEKQWLLERVDTPQIDWLRSTIAPMLAEPTRRLPDSPEYVYEVKWDGIRVLISLDEGEMRMQDEGGGDITSQFPELVVPEKAFRASSALFDGVIVCLDADGKPDVERLKERLKTKDTKHQACCYLFDCLYLDGRPIVNEPLARRREWLQDAIKKETPYRVSEAFEDGALFFQAAKDMGVAAILAKRRDSAYLPGKRTDAWLKIATRKVR
jgi:ATP-dependent DNA ligase